MVRLDQFQDKGLHIFEAVDDVPKLLNLPRDCESTVANAGRVWQIAPMNGVAEIESTLRQLPRQDKWQIARWLIEELEENGQADGTNRASGAPVALPDYAARRRRVFGDRVVPNMVLVAREEERW